MDGGGAGSVVVRDGSSLVLPGGSLR